MDDACFTVRCCDLEVCIGNVRVIRDVSFDCCKGEWIVITGPNGAGKTTLLRTVNGLCPPSAGRVWALSSWIPGRSRQQAQRVWRRTGTVLQEPTLFETLTTTANVELGLRAAGNDRKTSRQESARWLERLGLADKGHAYPGELSGGERQRVALARAIAHRPQLLILDEPTAHLDHNSARIVLAAIKELVEQGATVVMASHHEAELASQPTCKITLAGGRVTSICR